MTPTDSRHRTDAVAGTARDATMSRGMRWVFWVVLVVCSAFVPLDALGSQRTPFANVQLTIALATGAVALIRGWFSVGVGRWVWMLFGIGMSFNGVGDVIFILSGEPNSVSIADVFYLPSYPFLLAAAATLVIGRSGREARNVFFDATIVAVVSGLAIWQFLVVNPGVSSEGPLAQRIVFSAYPMGGSLIVAAVVGLCVAPGARSVALWGILAFSSLFLLSDIAYDISTVIDNEPLLRWSDGLYVLTYGVLMAAAIHPSARTLAQRSSVANVATSPNRLVLLGIALVGAPTLAVLTPSLGFDFQVPVYVSAAAAVAILTISRLGLLLRNIEQQRMGLERVQTALAHQAAHDGLTGLANRLQLSGHLDLEIVRAQGRGTHLAVLFLDLDRFKAVNDSLGHPVGDMLLVEAARRLRATVRDEDLVARLGGDEFVIVCPELAAPHQANDIAERVLRALRAPFHLDGRVAFTGASLGLAFCTDHATGADLIRDADRALYQAKEAGRDRFVVFAEQMGSWAAERASLETALEHAIERDELTLHYQPKVALPSGGVVGVEALLRWRHDEREIPVVKLIEIAEATGQIVSIGEWVLRQACRDLKQLNADCAVGLGVAINVSARQLTHPDFVGHVQAALADSGIDPGLVTLELTETSLTEDPDRARGSLTALRDLGVRIEIDDFGVGYSSLARLSRLPIDGMKIDRSFVAKLHESGPDNSVVEAVLALGAALDLLVTAEGVETRAQADLLTRMGCRLVQGFYFAPPLPFAAVTEYVARAGAFSVADANSSGSAHLSSPSAAASAL
jgi:diguanylate cyclase